MCFEEGEGGGGQSKFAYMYNVLSSVGLPICLISESNLPCFCSVSVVYYLQHVFIVATVDTAFVCFRHFPNFKISPHVTHACVDIALHDFKHGTVAVVLEVLALLVMLP